jgi:hypothetical protein
MPQDQIGSVIVNRAEYNRLVVSGGFGHLFESRSILEIDALQSEQSLSDGLRIILSGVRSEFGEVC